ncbi:MAG: hypothetical protein M1820_005047 [Bogoriella megaspora]|nr:MAG: hypothetical protein M1820_005047 [Bogoriella megaspora]
MLKAPTRAERLSLGQSIWSWDICDECIYERECKSSSCDAYRARNLMRYWTYYLNAILDYNSMEHSGADRSVASYEMIFKVIRLLQTQPKLTREELAKLADADFKDINLAVRLMTMIPCSYETGSFVKMEQGTNPIPWSQSISFDQFMEKALPTVSVALRLNAQQKAALVAKKLKKKIGVHLRPTNDLREHLKLERGRRVTLYIFHHTAFLKEHLRRTKTVPQDTVTPHYPRMGAIPRGLALEILDSIHKILFPLADRKSRKMLKNLIRNHSFDDDIIKYESAAFRNPYERDMDFLYLGQQLQELIEEVEHPRPHGRVSKLIQRNSHSRHMMMATLAGVAFAVLLGFLALIVTSFQTWITWQQWKHPIENPPG